MLGCDEVERGAAAVGADGFVRLVDEAVQGFGKPVIAARRSRLVAHPLLDDAPVPGGCEEKRVMIELVPILDGGTVDLGRHAARVHEGCRVDRQTIAARDDLRRRLS